MPDIKTITRLRTEHLERKKWHETPDLIWSCACGESYPREHRPWLGLCDCGMEVIAKYILRKPIDRLKN